MRWTTGGIIAITFLISSIRAAPLLFDDEDDPSRLPKSSVPMSYDISLITNVHTGDKSFSGVVKIDIEIRADTDRITLHNRGLTLISSRLYGNDVDDIPHSISSDESRDFFFITITERTLQVGEFYTVEIGYTGELDSEYTIGFFLSHYQMGTEMRYLAATQFQPTNARAVFFSYDEPEFEATFTLRITHASTYSAISNTDGTTVINGDGTSTTSFLTSPIMPTYLLAFVISDFDYSRLGDWLYVMKLQGVFRTDSSEISHPLTYDGIRRSVIVYDKAGSVMRMFQYAVGDELFKAAVSHYLNINNHQSVTSNESYTAVEYVLSETNFDKFNFTRAFKTWENQAGFPLIHVTADDVSRVFRVTQQRYFAAGIKSENDDSSWYIPLNFAVQSNPNFDDINVTDYFLDGQLEKTMDYPVNVSSTRNQWYIFNKQRIGYYRVNYDANNWQQIIRALNSDNFGSIYATNRAQLVDDALNLAEDEYLDYDIAFGILSYLSRETDYIPWRAAITTLDKLDVLFTGHAVHGNFQRFVRKLARLIYVKYGLEEKPGDTMIDQFARELAIDWTCRMGDERCLRDTYSYLRQIALEGLVVPKSLEITLICNGLRGLNRQEEFNAIWQRLLQSNDQPERSRLIEALTCSSDPSTLRDLLRSTFGPDAESSYTFMENQMIWSNIVRRSLISLDIIIEIIDEFYDERDVWQFGYAIILASSRIASDSDRIKLEELMDRLVARETNPLSADLRTTALNNMLVNTNWIASEKFSRASNFVNSFVGALDDEQNQFILPKTSEPRSYKIHITATDIPLGGRDFSGEIEIDTLVKETLDRITIHSREQTILDVLAFFKDSLTEIPIYDYSTFADAHTFTIYFLNEIPANSEIILRIRYSGLMQTQQINYGFHITSYVIDGETHYLGVTQFESSLGGRFAFPHYDEPRYKAKFQLTLTHSALQHAISNTFNTSVVVNGDGTVTTSFEETPTMSSYLLAFVISELESATNELTKEENDTLHRVWVRPDSVSKTWFAVEYAEKALKALEEYLSFDYALPKMDSAGIPDKSGAMENWGMITYWEPGMIFQENYEDITHAVRLQGVGGIMHEETHQFFGNSATFEWWDYLWLSEGFATLFEYQLTGVLRPEWRTRHFFNIRKLHNAFRYDAESNTRSMTPTPSLVTPTEIRASFDTIAYDKSGSVIRMFQHAVGETIFRAALNLYLTDNEYQSAVPQNLYDAFHTIMTSAGFTDFDFTTAFKTWETQRGYPVVYCTYSEAAQAIQTTQERYFTQKPESSNDTSIWYIPINFATQSDPNFDDTNITHYFNNQQSSITIPVATSLANQWFIVNKQQLGYYRVNYDASNWHAITLALNSREYENFHVLNRVQLIDDAVNFAAGNYITYDVLFGLLQYLSRETEYTPWFSADRFISQLYTAFGPFNPALNSFMRHLSKKIYDTFKLTNGIVPSEEVYERYGREIATRLACNAGYENCLEDTHNILAQFIDSNIRFPNGLENVVWCNGIRGASASEWNEMWNRMQTTSDTTFRSQILTALGCSRNFELLKQYLETTVSTGNSYTQGERRIVLSSVLNSEAGLQAVINFIGDFQASILSSYSYTLVDLLNVPAGTVKTRAQQTLFNDYLRTLTDLPESDVTSLTTIIENNFLAQQQSFYPQVIAMIEAASENQWRLPKSIEPTHYRLHLNAQNIPSGDRAFTGEVEMQVVVRESTDRILMHSKTQVINELNVFRADGVTELELLEYHLNPDRDLLTIYFVDYVVSGDELIIRIKYSTDLVLTATGFYRTSYFVGDEERFLGATQFESTGGRYAFPHFDEPGFKAVFDLSITHHASHNAIANTFGERVENVDGTATTTFAPSPIMSSYLLAFVVSDLESVDNEPRAQPEDTLHRVWVRPDSITKAWYAVEVSERVLKALEDYIDFKFELPKVDSAGVPNKGGAMENWGMVTYRENAMIYEEKYEDISHTQKWSGVDVISHELAHQFFGDTVTCEWWDTIWLNEGFATVFEYHLSGILYPNWRVRDLFNLRTLQNVFRNDARDITRPMTKPLYTPTEISNAFDYVVYAKAGSVIRMFQNTVGENIFRAALKLYLDTNNHKAINSQPLVDAFNAVMTSQGFNDFNFDVTFRTWELQAGYPVIHVSYSNTQFQITQQRFFTQRSQSVGDTSSWYIPINFATASNPNFDDTNITNYFVNGQQQYLINAPALYDNSQWFVFNKQQLGYYRVNYDLQNWNAISAVMNSDNYNNIHVLNRAQLIDDSYSFAEGDYLGYDVVLKLVGYLHREQDYPPWFAADRFITALYNAFGPFDDTLNEFVRTLSEHFYDTFKLTEEGVIPFDELFERFGRELALKIACNAGNERCLSDTFDVNKRFAQFNDSIPKGLEGVVLCSGLRGTGKQSQWNELYQRMQTTSDATLKSQLLNGLGCTDDTDRLNFYLQSTINNGNSYTIAQRQSVLNAVLNSQSGLATVITFVRDYESEILSLFGYNSLESLLTVAAHVIKLTSQQESFVNFLQTLTHLDASNATRITAVIDSNFQVQQEPRYVDSIAFIRQYLLDYQQTEQPTTNTPPTNTQPTSTTSGPNSAASFNLQVTTLIACLFTVFVLKLKM